MSAINLSGNASGSGTLTITSPNTNSNFTLSLPEEAGTITTSNSPYSTFRNRIINGDMRIDQRNAGAAVTASGAFPVDRFSIFNTTDGAFSAQQDSSAPAGFVNSVKVTTTTADGTLTTTQAVQFRQLIEGTNISDLAWGSASAKPVTLSFWVRSSLTGTFGGSLKNSSNTRSYPFTYAISSADTWEYKTVTVDGDTTGTWLTTTGTGINVIFGLGVGPDLSGTAGAWAGTNYVSATGATSVIGTLNATWYITGVQLEVGSVATPFERRPYGTELILCQRYLPAWRFNEDNPEYGFSGQAGSATGGLVVLPFLVEARTRPTGIVVSSATHFQMLNANQTSGLECSAVTFNRSSKYSVMVGVTCATGLTAGNMSFFSSKNTSAVLYATGCEL